ncbi:aspartate/glutamate racemase family protein [Streptomyces apocyni]|uniref:aspartate/glutamate racemase family protein n=1 Tax=Streptomyces apocyni TaxID=2654677 RepID=UPI0012E9E659|nr:aspartate/glutamate racemase family protein [Streptomyces apocyni]
MLALLHTSPAHIPVFDALRDQDHPALELRHFVREELLAQARVDGPRAVADAVRALLADAVAQGASAVLCTCSTIGAVAEAQAQAEAATIGVPVLRVDRPMAAAAVATGPRIVVLATVESTLDPTVALVEEEARRAGRPVEVRTQVVEGAWDCFDAGDREGCTALVVTAVGAVRDADVVVLAQASMAPAADRAVSVTRVPVLSSPRMGLRAAALRCGNTAAGGRR